MKDKIAQENKKAIPRFIAMMLLCGFVGGVAGFLMTLYWGQGLTEQMLETLRSLTRAAVSYVLPALGAVLLLIGLGLYLGARKKFKGWDGEEESVADYIENRLNYVMGITAFVMVMDLFIVSASRLTNFALWPIICFFVLLIGLFLLQQKAVDLTRRMNPEKQGSIYERNFQKKWLESCDEAERAQIGQAAYSAYQAAVLACVIIWLIVTILNFQLDIGLLPAVVALVILAVLQLSYCICCIKLGKGK